MVGRPLPVPRPAPSIRVVSGGKRSRVWLPPWVVFTLLAVAMFFALIYSRVALDHSAFRLTDLQRQVAEAEAHHEELRMEVARLESPDRIARAAEGLGLVLPAEPPRTLTVQVPTTSAGG